MQTKTLGNSLNTNRHVRCCNRASPSAQAVSVFPLFQLLHNHRPAKVSPAAGECFISPTTIYHQRIYLHIPLPHSGSICIWVAHTHTHTQTPTAGELNGTVYPLARIYLPFSLAYDWVYVLFVTQRKESILSRRTHVHKRCEQKQKKNNNIKPRPISLLTSPAATQLHRWHTLADKREPYARKVINISSVTSCLARGETWVCSRFSVQVPCHLSFEWHSTGVESMWSIARTLLWREVETNSSYSRGDKAYRRGFKCLPLDDNVPKRDGFTFEDLVFFSWPWTI